MDRSVESLAGTLTGPAAIELRGVSKSFGEIPAVKPLNLTVQRNEFFTLLGPSGCGKTTLLRMIAGFDHPTSGQIHIEGERVDSVAPFLRPVNTVFQSYALFPHMTVAENIAFGLEMRKVPPAERRQRVAEMIKLVRLEGLEQRLPDRLSGGQQQRVAFARALANRPKVLLLDEPLSALDLKLRREMQLEIKRFQASTATTFIFVTHDQEEALSMSDRIAVMRDGEIQQIGTPEQIYDQPANRFVADFVGESNLIPGALLGEDPRGVVAIRPERVTLVGSGASGSSRLVGTVSSVSFLGADVIYHVALPDRSVIRVRTREGVRHKCGASVGVSWPMQAARLLED